MAERWKEAGLPDGVFNVVLGDKIAVDRLLNHPDSKAVSFVGSTPSAQYVYATGPQPASASRPSAERRTT
jgi:malonate-semialdehyde dehydrogenase (acetylating) / methylmalonate-semialdehyde dehydrogenase